MLQEMCGINIILGLFVFEIFSIDTTHQVLLIFRPRKLRFSPFSAEMPNRAELTEDEWQTFMDYSY